MLPPRVTRRVVIFIKLRYDLNRCHVIMDRDASQSYMNEQQVHTHAHYFVYASDSVNNSDSRCIVVSSSAI